MNNENKEQKVIYNGYQFNDFLDNLLNEFGLLYIDLSKMTYLNYRTILKWKAGDTIPNRNNMFIILNELAKRVPERKDFVKENMAIYESIKKQRDLAIIGGKYE